MYAVLFNLIFNNTIMAAVSFDDNQIEEVLAAIILSSARNEAATSLAYQIVRQGNIDNQIAITVTKPDIGVITESMLMGLQLFKNPVALDVIPLENDDFYKDEETRTRAVYAYLFSLLARTVATFQMNSSFTLEGLDIRSDYNLGVFLLIYDQLYSAFADKETTLRTFCYAVYQLLEENDVVLTALVYRLGVSGTLNHETLTTFYKENITKSPTILSSLLVSDTKEDEKVASGDIGPIVSDDVKVLVVPSLRGFEKNIITPLLKQLK